MNIQSAKINKLTFKQQKMFRVLESVTRTFCKDRLSLISVYNELCIYDMILENLLIDDYLSYCNQQDRRDTYSQPK